MTKTENAITSKFHAFLKKRNSKTNVAMQEAQRLVNLYRVLGTFGSDFVDEYNVMLLNSSDEVQMALNALVSGQEVRQYLEFLQQEENGGDDAEKKEKVLQTGWLPTPEEEMAQAQPVAAERGVSNAEWVAFMKEEEEKIAKVISSLREEQEMVLKNLSDQLTSTLQIRPGGSPKAQAPEDYSEIIEEKGKEK